MTEQRDIASILDERIRRQGADHVFAHFTKHGPLTLGGLDQAAAKAASSLAARGAVPGTRVMLAARTSPQLLAVMLGAWRIGAMVLPVDIFMQPKALADFFRNYKADLMVVDRGLPWFSEFGARQELQGRLVALDELDKADGQPLRSDADAPALCIFTSGSTGIPKGVVHTQASLLAGADNASEGKGYAPEDTVLCVLPMSHLNGLITTFLGPLAGGYGVVYLQENFTPDAALAALERHGCAVLSATPTQYALLAGVGRETRIPDLPDLRFCRSASAPLSAKVHRAFEERYNVPIIETMGTSETAGQIFTNPMPPGERKISSVGLPVGFEVRLVDDQDQACAPGRPGEILVKGEGLMQGYLDDPEETAKVMDQGWFRTGDVARMDEDGYYFIVGRKKDIIIFGGINVSLPQIERLVREAPLVGDAAMVPRSHEIFGETFDAFVVSASEDGPTEEDAAALAKVMREVLPNPQCLSRILFVPEFPRSSVGKVLKGKLDPGAAVLSWAPTNRTGDVRAFVADVLEVDQERIHDELMFGNIAEWDSMAYLAMLAAVEGLLDRTLEPDEMDKLMSVKGIRSLLEGGDEDVSVGVYDYGLHL